MFFCGGEQYIIMIILGSQVRRLMMIFYEHMSTERVRIFWMRTLKKNCTIKYVTISQNESGMIETNSVERVETWKS
jgi:hypothetical protein